MNAFESTKPISSLKRAYLGNGYLGIDVSSNFGQGFGVLNLKNETPNNYLAGVYSEFKNAPIGSTTTLFSPFSTHILIPFIDEIPSEFFLPSNFYQKLNIKEAYVETRYSIPTKTGKEINVESEIFLSRETPQIGALRLDIKYNGNEPLKLVQISRKADSTKIYNFKHEFSNEMSLISYSIKEDRNPKNPEFQISQGTFIDLRDEQGNKIEFQSESPAITKVGDGFDEKIEIKKIINISKNNITAFLYFSICDCRINISPIQFVKSLLQNSSSLGYSDLFSAHKKRWQKDIYSKIFKVSDLHLQKYIDAAFFQIGCTFNRGYNYSAGPTGINWLGWEGHVFWDADLWMNLGVVLWAPEFSRSIAEFRTDHIESGKTNRINYCKTNKFDWITEGAKMPWQAASSGLECAPPRWDMQEHISCDVVFGQWIYVASSGDMEYLKNKAYPLVKEICNYLSQRVRKKKDEKYHFRKVIPADEFPFPKAVDDNAFTNLYTVRALMICKKWSEQLGLNYPLLWDDIIENMYFPFDKKKRWIPEFEGYKGKKIKQADTDLLAFPLEYPFPRDIKENNMRYYFKKLPKNKIMMGSSISATIAAELGLLQDAEHYFMDLLPHFHEDSFLSASESPNNQCAPFITGVSGFIFALSMGFGGLRIRDDGLLINPNIPKSFGTLEMPHIQFRDNILSLKLKSDGSPHEMELLSGNSCEICFYFPITKGIDIEGAEIIEKKNVSNEFYGKTQFAPILEQKYKLKLSKHKTIRFLIKNT
jgi:trehalose/maltose hydrolase-like predicted phosphorylase